ncbi:MAG: hypothetical protein JSS72_07175 [Armatimonadetes bacterium]|nr:hypothetical protein [Armatimonadota bacterium]
MNEAACTRLTLAQALEELKRQSPSAKLLALGQTVFWDEPMKVGVAIALQKLNTGQKFVAGVHDTDYFAKLPRGKMAKGEFKAFPHNDTKTKGLWSASAEFSALFGSETVITRESLASAGLRIAKLSKNDPDLLDSATEAWGWRGIVALGDTAPIAADVPLRGVFAELFSTLKWALDLSVQSFAPEDRAAAQERADQFLRLICDSAEAANQNASLTDWYRTLLSEIYRYLAGDDVDVHATVTTELLRFNSTTCDLPRFDLLKLFVDYRTREQVCEAYNEAIKGSGIFDLHKFGTGAIPFDAVIPGVGRGTIRLGTRGAVIETPKPSFLSFSKPIESLTEFAVALERKFGPDCVIVGKAVTLIGTLAREFSFVFHEGASPYVKNAIKFHAKLAEIGHPLELNPILRIRYEIWDALEGVDANFQLPDSIASAFPEEHISAKQFAGSWRATKDTQCQRLCDLGAARSSGDLIEKLVEYGHPEWQAVRGTYRELLEELKAMQEEIQRFRTERHAIYAQLREQKQNLANLEKEKGNHFRAEIFEKTPTPEALAKREEYGHRIHDLLAQNRQLLHEAKESLKRQEAYVRSEHVMQLHHRREEIERNAERERLEIIKVAITASKGLANANRRPSAWWFPLVSPDGEWFRRTIATAQCYLEPLV